MDRENPSCITKMLDEFRSGTQISGVTFRPATGSRLSGAFPLPNTPLLGPKESTKMPFDESILNQNEFLIKKKRKMSFDDSISLDISIDDSGVTASPWEYRRLKNELVEARAEITTLETRITQLHNLRKETELLFMQEKGSLKQTIERDRNSIKDLENRIKVLKKRDEKLKEELATLVASGDKDRQLLESKTLELQQENMNLKLRVSQIESENSEKARELSSAKTEVSSLQSELESIRHQYQSLSTQITQLNKVSRQYEIDKAAFIAAQHTIKELENELKTQADVAALVKSQHTKLTRYSDLEKQLNNLLQENTKLRDTTSNSIYLEGVVEDLRGRLKSIEEREAELVQVRIQLGIAQSQLADYTALGNQVLGTGASGATALANYLRELHSEHLLAKSHQSQLQAKLKTLEEIHEKSLCECNTLKAEVEKLKQELEQNVANIRRLKKQNALVTWERNDLRSLVDSCQKEVTMTSGEGSGATGGGLVDPKVEALERLVDGYRKRIQQLENDPTLAQGISISGESVCSSAANAGAVAEIEALKKERQQLLEKIDSMEYEMEHRALKGDFNTQNTKILHLKVNPISEAESKQSDELDKCRLEILKLRERVKLLQEGRVADITQTVETNVDENTVKEVEVLREKVKSKELQNQRLREAFQKMLQEFREAVSGLLGYKVVGLPNNIYKLSSIYADDPEQQFLLFKMLQNGGKELLETEFSKTLSDLMEIYLHAHDSIPAFLSSVTIDLLQRQSQSYIIQ